jgi:hypothetical protein
MTLEMFDIGITACGKIINYGDVVSVGDQPVGKMASDKPRAACNKDIHIYTLVLFSVRSC